MIFPLFQCYQKPGNTLPRLNFADNATNKLPSICICTGLWQSLPSIPTAAIIFPIFNFQHYHLERDDRLLLYALMYNIHSPSLFVAYIATIVGNLVYMP